MRGQLESEEHPGLDPDLGAVQHRAVLGQVQRPRARRPRRRAADEHVEGGEAEVPLVEEARDEGADGLAGVGADHGGGEVGEDDPGEGAAAGGARVDRQLGRGRGRLAPLPETHRLPPLGLQGVRAPLPGLVLPAWWHRCQDEEKKKVKYQ